MPVTATAEAAEPSGGPTDSESTERPGEQTEQPEGKAGGGKLPATPSAVIRHEQTRGDGNRRRARRGHRDAQQRPRYWTLTTGARGTAAGPSPAPGR